MNVSVTILGKGVLTCVKLLTNARIATPRKKIATNDHNAKGKEDSKTGNQNFSRGPD